MDRSNMDKKKLAALGTSALLSYGFISNINAITLLITAWVSFAKSTGLSPLAPGQWKARPSAGHTSASPALRPAS